MVEGWIDDRPLVAEAARRGNLDVVRLLAERGGDPHQVGKDGSNALAWAIEEGHEEIACYLKQAGASG